MTLALQLLAAYILGILSMIALAMIVANRPQTTKAESNLDFSRPFTIDEVAKINEQMMRRNVETASSEDIAQGEGIAYRFLDIPYSEGE
jgi:hypothetical protein